MKCCVCNKDMDSRKGKQVCSATCRGHKKQALDYFNLLFSQLKSITKLPDDRIIQEILDDEKKRKRSIRMYNVWIDSRTK